MKLIDKINNKIGWFFTNGNKTVYKAKPTKSNFELKTVNDILKSAKEHHVEAEVVVFALRFMKTNSNLSIEEAMQLAFFQCVDKTL